MPLILHTNRSRSLAATAPTIWVLAKIAAIRYPIGPLHDRYSPTAILARWIAAALAAPLGPVLLQHILFELLAGLLTPTCDAGHCVQISASIA